MPDIEVKPGAETSEFSLSKLVFWVGTAVTAVGAVLTALSQSGFGENKWVGLGLSAVGALMLVLRAAGYQASRDALKTEAMKHAAADNAAARAEVKDLNSAAAHLESLLEKTKEPK